MIEKTGNLFDTDAPAIGHGVNCQGLMGAGIAKLFRNIYPKNYQIYADQCSTGGLRPGGMLITNGGVQFIVNMASQNYTGADASYYWLSNAAFKAAEQLLSIGVNRCAIPEIGCGIGGLEWDNVDRIFRVIEDLLPSFEWEVWHYEG